MWKTIDALGDAYAAGVIDGIDCVRRRAGSNDCFDDTNTMGRPMAITFNFNGSPDLINCILHKLENLEQKMATLQEIVEAARANTDAMKAQLETSRNLIVEVRQYLAKNDIPGADALLADMEAQLPVIQAATLENTDLAHLVDSVNGDPAPV